MHIHKSIYIIICKNTFNTVLYGIPYPGMHLKKSKVSKFQKGHIQEILKSVTDGNHPCFSHPNKCAGLTLLDPSTSKLIYGYVSESNTLGLLSVTRYTETEFRNICTSARKTLIRASQVQDIAGKKSLNPQIAMGNPRVCHSG